MVDQGGSERGKDTGRANYGKICYMHGIPATAEISS